MRRRLAIVSLVGLALLLLASPAGAAGSSPLADCEHNGSLTGSYTTAQLQQALRTMGVDAREYTDCYNILQHALLKKIGKLGGGVSAGGGGSFLPGWLIVVLALLVLSGAGFGIAALRNRGRSADPD